MKKTIKDMRQGDRPREKLILNGHDALTDQELLAIVIGNGTPKKNAIELAGEILETFTERQLLEIEVGELSKIEGIKEAKASKIVASLQLGKRIKEKIIAGDVRKISSNDDVYRLMEGRLAFAQKEMFYIIMLNSKNEVLGIREVSVGDLTSSIVNPREVFKPAVKNSAKSIILVHNHPSGNPEPSRADILSTHRLIEAGEILDIGVLDHIIIGDRDYISLKKEEYI